MERYLERKNAQMQRVLQANPVEGPAVETQAPSGRYSFTVKQLKYPWGVWTWVETSLGLKWMMFGPPMPFVWVEGHPDGHDYLVCKEEAQGITVVQLDTQTKLDYFPDEAFTDDGFHHHSWYPSPDKSLLATEGWHKGAGRKVVRIYDFRNPLLLPWPVLESPLSNELGTFFEWTSNSACSYGIRGAFCIPLNKFELDFTPEDDAAFESLEMDWSGVWDDRVRTCYHWSLSENPLPPQFGGSRGDQG